MSFTDPFKQVCSGGASNPSQQAHPEFISQLYSMGKYSDLIIKCQGKEFKVHRAIICPQSKPLAAAVDHWFEEATAGVINFEEDDPEIVEYMIKFLYFGTYKVFAQMNELTAPEMSQNARPPAEPHAPPPGEPPQKPLPPRWCTPSSEYITASGLGGLSGHGGGMFSSSNFASRFAPTEAPGDNMRYISSWKSRTEATPWSFGSYREAHPTNDFVAAARSAVARANFYSSGTFPPTPESATGSAASTPTNHRHVLGGNIDTRSALVQSSEGNFGWLGTDLTSIKFQAEDLVKHAKVYIMAEKYDIKPLKILARERHFTISNTCWDSSYFVESIEIIFDGTPEISGGDCLRNSALETASRHLKQLLAREDFTQLCQERGDIATSILQSVVM